MITLGLRDAHSSLRKSQTPTADTGMFGLKGMNDDAIQELIKQKTFTLFLWQLPVDTLLSVHTPGEHLASDQAQPRYRASH